MNRKRFGVPVACSVFVLFAGVTFAQTTATQGSSSQTTPTSQANPAQAEQQIRAAHRQLLDAARADDKEAARRLMADEMTWVNPSGVVTSKEEMLATTPTPPRSVNVDRVTPMGDAAVVTGSAELADGRRVRYLQEWVNRGGQWQLFAHQGTPVMTTPDPSQASATPPAAGTSGRTPMRGSAPTLATDEERAIWKTQQDLQKAFLTGNVTAYSSLTADEYIRVMPIGEPLGKSQFLQTVERNANRPGGQLEAGDVKISVMGNTARMIMTNWGTLPGGEPTPPSRVTRVFVKRGGQWQQAAAIFTPLEQR